MSVVLRKILPVVYQHSEDGSNMLLERGYVQLTEFVYLFIYVYLFMFILFNSAVGRSKGGR